MAVKKDALRRHDLVFFTRRAIDEVMRRARPVQPDAPRAYWDELFCAAGTGIPGIVRRQEHADGGRVDVGFSSPSRVNGVHYRVSASVPLAAVEEVVTPFEVIKIAAAGGLPPGACAVAEFDALGARTGVKTGLFGSRALQAVTGLAYTWASSDADVIVCGKMEALAGFAQAAAEVERRAGIGADIEARIPVCGARGGRIICDVKLRELVAPGAWLVGKSTAGALLLERVPGQRGGQRILVREGEC